jgi:hypothetical protein
VWRAIAVADSRTRLSAPIAFGAGAKACAPASARQTLRRKVVRGTPFRRAVWQKKQELKKKRELKENKL